MGPVAGDAEPRRYLGGTDEPVRTAEKRQVGAGEGETGTVRVYKRARARHETEKGLS